MKKTLRKIFRTFLIFTVILIIAAGIFLLYLHTGAGQNFLKDIIQDQIRSNLNLRAEIGSLETNVLSHFKADKIMLYPAAGTKNPPLVSLNRFEVRYNLFNLVFGETYIDYLSADSLTIFVTRDSTGKLNLPSVESDGEDTGPAELPVKLGKVEVKKINLVYNDDYTPLKITCSNMNISILQTLKVNNYSLSVSADSINVLSSEKARRIKSLIIGGDLRSDLAFNLKTINTEIENLTLKGSLAGNLKSIKGIFKINGNPESLIKSIAGKLPVELSPDLNALLNLSVEFPDTSVKISLDTDIPSYAVNNIPVNNFKLSAGWFSDTLFVNKLSFNTLGGNAWLSGRVLFDSLLTSSLSFNAEKISLKTIARDYTGDFLIRPLYTDLRFKGRGNLLSPAGMEIYSGLKVYNQRDNYLNAAVVLKENKLSVRSDNSIIDIVSAGKISEKGYYADFNIKIPDINLLLSLAGYEDFKGVIEIHSQLEGNYTAISSITGINSDGIFFRDKQAVDSVSIKLNNLAITEGKISGSIPASFFDIDGLTGEFRYSISPKGSLQDPHVLIKLMAEKPGYGNYYADQSEINLSANKDTILVSGFLLKKDSLTVAVSGSAFVSEQSGRIKLDVSRNTSDLPDTAYLEFSFDSPDNYSASFRTENLHLKYFNELVPSLKLYNGQLSSELSFKNIDSQPDADLLFAFSDLKRGNLHIDSLTGALRLHNDWFSVDSAAVVLDNNKAYLDADLKLRSAESNTYAIDKSSETKGRMYADSLELQLLNPFIESYLHLQGYSSLDLNWNGSLSDPGLNGKLHFDDGSITLSDTIQLVSELNGDIFFGNSRMETSRLSAQLVSKPVLINADIQRPDTATLSASLNLTSNDSVLLTVGSMINRDSIAADIDVNNLDISLAGAIFPAAKKLQGSLYSKLDINGPLKDPALNGAVRLSNVSFDPQILNQKLTNGELTARITNSEVVIDTGFFNAGKGSLSMRGDVKFNDYDLKEIDLALTGSDLSLSEPEFYSVKVKKVNLNMGFDNQKYKLAGSVQLGTSRYVRNFELTNLWEILAAKTEDVIKNKSSGEPLDLMGYVEEYPQKLISFSDYFKNLDLEISIENSDSIWVDNNIAKFRVRPNLTLSGSIETPLLSGRVTVLEDGKIRFLDRQFDIKKGIIEFENPLRIDPVVDVSAQSEITSNTGDENLDETYLVTMNVTGPVDDIDFNLSSDPLLDGTDIISLLSLGVTYQQLQASEDANALLKDRAGVLTGMGLTDQITKYYNKWLGDFLQIDRIGVGGNIFNPRETRFEVSKSFAGRVEVSYSTKVDEIDKQILKAKLKLIRYLYLEGKTDQDIESGIDLIFHYKFK